MEDSTPRRPDSKNKDDTAEQPFIRPKYDENSKPESFTDSFQRILGLAEGKEEDEEETEEETVSTTKSGRFKKGLSRLFPRQVEKPLLREWGTSSQEADQHPDAQEDIDDLPWTVRGIASREATVKPETSISRGVSGSTERADDVESSGIQDRVLQTPQTNENQSIHLRSHATTELPAPLALHSELLRTPDVLNANGDGGDTVVSTLEQVSAGMPDTYEQRYVTHEQLSDTKGALLSVDALGYAVARHRHTKSKREQGHINRQVGHQQKVLETRQQATDSRVYNLEQIQSRSEITNKPAVRLERLEVNSVEQPAHRPVEAEPSSSQSTSKREQAPQPRIETIKHLNPETAPAPENILHRVEHAANNNTAIESLYEKRHEVKGNNTLSEKQEVTGSTEELVALPTQLQQNNVINTTKSSKDAGSSTAAARQSYKKPAQVGSLVAIAILVVLLLVFLLKP